LANTGEYVDTSYELCSGTLTGKGRDINIIPTIELVAENKDQ
jgi:hypothetical protein